MDDGEHGTQPATSALDSMLCFGLYAAARATTRRYALLLAPWRLTYPQYLVLILLWERRSLTVTSVAESLMLDVGTTSPLIRRLESRGFVARERSASDERRVLVSLTPAGLALREELAHIPAGIADATRLTLSDGKAALSLLHDVTTNLSNAPGVGVPLSERQN